MCAAGPRGPHASGHVPALAPPANAHPDAPGSRAATVVPFNNLNFLFDNDDYLDAASSRNVGQCKKTYLTRGSTLPLLYDAGGKISHGGVYSEDSGNAVACWGVQASAALLTRHPHLTLALALAPTLALALTLSLIQVRSPNAF